MARLAQTIAAGMGLEVGLAPLDLLELMALGILTVWLALPETKAVTAVRMVEVVVWADITITD